MGETGYPGVFWLFRGSWNRRNMWLLFIVIVLVIITFVLMRPID
jgi:hypothetical protein